MGLFQDLCQIYDILAEQQVENLLPIGFSKQNVQIECLLFADGDDVELAEAEVIRDKKDMPTILPVTEESAGRTSKPVAHPLFDKLCYISKDYMKYCDESQFNQRQLGERQKMFGLYIKELESFLGSVEADREQKVDYDVDKVGRFLSVLHRYLTQKNIIEDLADLDILTIVDGKLRTEENKEKTALLKILPKPEQGEAMIRFCIQIEEDESQEIWNDIDVWKAYLSHINKKEGKDDWCAITGQYAKIAEKHPRYIRMPGDGAKLISSNDAVNYTYRGRFIESSEPNAISYIASEKMHSALKYLIKNQGFSIDNKVFLHFHSENRPIPKLDLEEINTELAEKETKIKSVEKLDSTSEVVANQIHRALLGRGSGFGSSGTITTLILDAATPGRLSVLYYNELPDNRFLERIKLWHDRSSWENRFFIPDQSEEVGKEHSERKGRSLSLTRAPTLWSLIDATVGRNADDKLKKEVYQRILISIVQGQPIPKDLMLMSVRRASQTMSMDPMEWRKQLGIACSLYRNYYWEKESYTMELDNKRTDRSYLYGRLLAVADKIERDALYTKAEDGAKRTTNAWRYMVSFSNHPYRTWNIIFNAINPYMSQLEQKNPAKARYYQKEIADIYALFEEADYESNRSLQGSYLMGFFCENKKLWEKHSSAGTDNFEADENE
ncbi:MAG: type I-C CRISPR-associated protein Cas8c/Csd1 [Peptostreptococcaceae bacterium]|nr:type I-C CRISPR-associated protein Cas8c/Csd1 [Peptostreptococcaceae bacterium]